MEIKFISAFLKALTNGKQPDQTMSNVLRVVLGLDEPREKVTFDTSAWDGSAVESGLSAPEFCSVCLIDTNTGNGEKVKSKCKLPVRKRPGAAINKAALRTLATGRGVPAVQASPEDKKRAANFAIRYWPQAFGQPAPENLYRIAGKQRPNMKFVDMEDGIYYFGVYSNNYQDREDEILTKDSHKRFIQFTQEQGIKLPLILMHKPFYPRIIHIANLAALLGGSITSEQYNQNLMTLYGKSALAVTERLFELDGMAFVVAKVLPDKEELVRRILIPQQDRLGMSHGFLVSDKSGNIINEYFSHELSVVPVEIAANGITIGIFKDLGDSTDMADLKALLASDKLSEEDREFLKDYFEKNKIESLEEGMRLFRQVMGDLLDSKELAEQMPDEEEQQPDTPDYDEIRTKLFVDLNVEGLKSVLEEITGTLQKLDDRINEVTSRLDAVEETEDNKVASLFDTRKPVWDWKSVTEEGEPEEDEKTLIDELKDNIPDQIVPGAEGHENDPGYLLFAGPLGWGS